MHYNIKSIIYGQSFNVSDKEKNIYIKLFSSIKNAIIMHELEQGLKLPPSRVLAGDLSISRSTVVKAYDLLLLEKYIYSIQGSGYYIRPVKNKKTKVSLQSDVLNSKYPSLSKRAKAFSDNKQRNNSVGSKVAFRPGLPPLDVFPTHLWKKLTNSYWKTITPSKLSYSNPFGLTCLKNSISNYLKIYRNIECHTDQLIITSGTIHSLSLVSDALINNNDNIILENFIYPQAYRLFKSLGATINSVPVDVQGIRIQNARCKNPKLVYSTPSNQYPTGVKMSLNRRKEVLKWASLNQTVIIEDDYDHEFSNWDNPISSLYSLDHEDRTVYLGTFNKLLHPSLRVGYMIVPDFLKDSILSLYEKSSRFVPPATQTVLSYFIDKDYLNRHLRNVTETSKKRKLYFIKQFNKNFNQEIKIKPNTIGLHVIGELDPKFEDVQLSAYFMTKGIIANPYSNYFINNEYNINGLVMGYASVNERIIKRTIEKMYREFQNFKRRY